MTLRGRDRIGRYRGSLPGREVFPGVVLRECSGDGWHGRLLCRLSGSSFRPCEVFSEVALRGCGGVELTGGLS